MTVADELLQDGRIEASADLARKLLRASPDNDEALYILAVCQRYLKQFDSALDSLDKLKALRPAYGRAWQEEGHVHIAAGDALEAKKAFQQAVARNNSLIASWKALIGLSSNDHDRKLFEEASEQYRRLAALPAELLSVRNMMIEKQLFKAEQLCRSFLKKNPKNVEGMRLLADLGVKSQVLDDAEFILESAVEFEPDNRFARFDYIHVLYRRQKYSESLEQARILLALEPDNPDYKITYANQCVATDDYDTALEIYDNLADQSVNKRPGLHLVRGHALKTIGGLEDAIESYRRSYRARPDFGDAYWSLANLKTYRFTNTEVTTMREAEKATTTALDDRIHLCFALGKHFEDDQGFEISADYYLRGNALKKDEQRYDARRMSERLALQQEFCSRDFFATNSGVGYKAPDPIFIVGLPRAGSTLLEQILASHSQVDGTLELPNIISLAERLNGRRRIQDESRYPAILGKLAAEDFKKFGEKYIADTQIHRKGAAFFIDKMPNNFRHIALIHLILPNAKIIDARRHPMACCFSGFKQLFASGQEFTYGLQEIGTYYKDYVELMDHWDRVLPGKSLRTSRRRSEGFSTIASCHSRRRAWSSTRRSARFVRQARNRFVSRFTRRAWSHGVRSSHTSIH
jgi:tetratricopeptide (TPR) repeat protein